MTFSDFGMFKKSAMPMYFLHILTNVTTPHEEHCAKFLSF